MASYALMTLLCPQPSSAWIWVSVGAVPCAQYALARRHNQAPQPALPNIHRLHTDISRRMLVLSTGGMGRGMSLIATVSLVVVSLNKYASDVPPRLCVM